MTAYIDQMETHKMNQTSFHTVNLNPLEIRMLIEVLNADAIASSNRDHTERDYSDVDLMEFYHSRAMVLRTLKTLEELSQ